LETRVLPAARAQAVSRPKPGQRALLTFTAANRTMPIGWKEKSGGARMRLFHISDLHLGKKLNEASLLEDQRHMLRQALALADREKPDALLIAGDVYDKPVPSAEAVGLLDEFLTGLAERNLPVVAISGNHDSAERLAFGSRLLSARNVYLSPVFAQGNATLRPIRLTDEYGPVSIWPLPFIKPAHVRAALPGTEAATYTEALVAVLATLPMEPSERNVLVSHQFITGGVRSDSEDVSVGGLDNVDAAVFYNFDYVALGHLHRAQRVGRPEVCYSGSPLAYSFSEAGDEKSLTAVDLGPKGTVSVRALPLHPLHALREARGLYADLTLRAHYMNTQREDYLRVTLLDEQDVPDALAKLQTIYPNLLRLDYDNARTRENRQVNADDAPERRTPLNLLEQLYTLQNNQPLGPEQRAYSSALLERIWEGRV